MEDRNLKIEHPTKILEVDLSTKAVSPKDLATDTLRSFLGGVGLGVKILYDEVRPSVDALSPGNVIIIAPGSLSGTDAPTSGRTDIVTKSPLTGGIGRGNFGGLWGHRLKWAGFDGVVIKGKADKPVYLMIDNEIAEVRGAEHLWGEDTWQTISALKRELGDDVSVLAIGQAGENLVRFACPVADYDHAPGRSHAGCVMGAKKLKAIAVRGTKKVPIANPDGFRDATKEVERRIDSFPEGGDRPRTGSNSGYTVVLAKTGVLPCKNYQQAFPTMNSDIWRIPEAVLENSTIPTDREYCYHCPLAKYYGCNLRADVKIGPYTGLDLGGVAFSAPGHVFGANCGIESWPALWKCRELCQRYGMDETSTAIPFAMELFQRGIISKEDAGGIPLDWGNEYGAMRMLGEIAYRKGFGNILAEGTVRAAKMIGKGARELALTVKGMDMYVIDPRVYPWGQILGWVVGPRGDDSDTTHWIPETFPEWAKQLGWREQEYLQWHVNYLDMFDDVKARVFGMPPTIQAIQGDTITGKAELVIWFEKLHAVFNSLGLCLMAGSGWTCMGPTHYAKLYSACTGLQVTPQEIMRSGDRIFNLMKAFMVREGFSRKDDNWPRKFYHVAYPGGPYEGHILSKDKMDRLLDEYYELRGWDIRSGVPTRKTLVELGLGYVADELAGLSLIPS